MELGHSGNIDYNYKLFKEGVKLKEDFDVVCKCDLIPSARDIDIFLDHLHVYQTKEEVSVVRPPNLGDNVGVKGDTGNEVTIGEN